LAQSLYITAMGPGSGKSVVTLGLMDLLTRRVGSVGFFRPVVRSSGAPDNDLELIRTRYHLVEPYDFLYALTSDEVRAMADDGEGPYDAALKAIMARFKELEHRHEFVLCEGTDFTGVSAPVEFEFNAEVAAHLGIPVVVVVNGTDREPVDLVGAVRIAAESLASRGAAVVAVVVNRVAAELVDDVRALVPSAGDVPVYVLPESSQLVSPTLGELARALDADLLFGEPARLEALVHHVKVAAMGVPRLLDHLDEGTLLITPGDRADVLLAAVVARDSAAYPDPVGLVLTGGLVPDPTVVRLLEGLRVPPPPTLAVALDTYDTAVAVTGVETAVSAGNDRKIETALALFEDNVVLPELAQRINVVRSTRVTPLMFEYDLIERAKADRRHVVLPEGDDDRILEAADQLLRRGVCDLTILGEPSRVKRRATELALDLGAAQVVDPLSAAWLDDFAATYYELRKHKGVTQRLAHDIVTDVSYFGTMMVHQGLADAMVSGAAHTTAHTIRPALEFIKTRPGVGIVSSVFFMCLADRVLVYGDCAVNTNPDAEQLADIAISSAETAAQFGVVPLVAMLSYSTGTSGAGEDVDKVREATELVRERRPDLKVEGPIQYDAAVDATVAAAKLPGSEVAGHATVFVFPDLNTGNNTYKAVQRSAGAVAIGPVLQGLNKPVNDLSRGALVADIVNTVAITAIQAQAVRARAVPAKEATSRG
jgi:phosphate acetyltransferase